MRDITKEEFFQDLIEMIETTDDAVPCETGPIDLIKEIKLQRQDMLNGHTSGNVTALIALYDTLLAELDKKAA